MKQWQKKKTKRLFCFCWRNCTSDGKLVIDFHSLDVDSFFTNIALKETINIFTNLLYNNVDDIEGISKSEFENLLSLATQESYFMLNDVL